MRMLPLAIILGLATPLPADEFVVNEVTTGAQVQRVVAVASDTAGNFVVVWQGEQDATGAPDIFASRFHSDASRAGADIRVNTYTTGGQYKPAVAVHPDGRFVVVWRDETGGGHVQGQRFDAFGAPVGAEFRASTSQPYLTGLMDVAADASGRFVVVWAAPDGSSYGIRAQRYDAAGARAGGELAVSSFTPGPQVEPAVAMHGDGSFVVAWRGGRAGYTQGVAARRFAADGGPLGSELDVSADGAAATPQVEVSADGGFTAVWVGSGSEIWTRSFDAAGVPTGPDRQVSPFGRVREPKWDPALAINADGTVVITYQKGADDVFEQHARTGAGFSPPLRVNETQGAAAGRAAVAATGADGEFVVTWNSPLLDVVGRKIQPHFHQLPR